ncbi:MAG: peptidylprolyl isomerase [Chloroflexota bacterium]|nr:peptidylprolyl isomerase [Chloroflexota bacterium]
MNLKATGRLVALALLFISTACVPMPVTSEPHTSAPLVTATAPTPTHPTPTDVPPSLTPELPIAVLVNGQPIYLADYERKLGQYEASLPAQGIDPNSSEGQAHLAQSRVWILDVMIEQALTEQVAAAAGVVISDSEVDAYMQEMVVESGGEEAFMDKLAEWGETREDAWQEVRAQLIGMAMTQRVIEGVPATAEHVHARHILLDTSQEAERILAQLQAGADFAVLARTYSQDASTRESGGDLGFFPRGILVAPEVEEAAFALQPGQFSGVVTSLLGYHIVQVIERDPSRPVGPENLRFLQDQAVHEWTEGLWGQAVIQRFVETTP